MSQPNQPQQQNGSGKDQQAALPPWAFSVGVLPTENASDYNQSVQMLAGTKRFPDVKIEPDGWLRGVWFDINAVTSANAATVAFTEDAPFNFIDTVLLKDTGGEQIFGPFGGYDWENVNKFGGYQAIGDPRSDPNFSVTTGVGGGLGGSAHFTMYLPLQVAQADGLGTVENRSENSIYRVEVTLAASASVYSTPPTTLPLVTIQTVQDAYTEPVAAMALSGRPISTAPPSPGTLQYWKQESPQVAAGNQSAYITNGLGHAHRAIIAKLIRNAGTRANGQADFPDPMELTLGTTRLRNLPKALWGTKMARAFELNSATADTARGPENGVFVTWFNQDVSLKPGNEARRAYLRTKTGNTFKFRGNFGNAGVLFLTSNYIVPAGNNFATVVA